MSRGRASLSPSLFPFLAVLVCTLGTLILLLALVAQEARDAAEHNAKHKQNAKQKAQPVVAKAELERPTYESPPSMTAKSAKELLEQERFRVTELVSLRDTQTAEVETRRDQLTSIDDHARRLKEKLKRLSDEVEAATSPEEALHLDEQTLVLMKEEIAKLKADIKSLEENNRGDKPRVVIVPHRGPNGTQRRPIYVECDADGVTIKPEGSRITHAQLLAAAQSRSPRSNPLDAALRAVRQHAMRVYGDLLPPYPLLVVRPDGIHTYMAARGAMKDWDDQYGYELVPGEVDLAFPKLDPVLQKSVELAIHEASVRQFPGGRGLAGMGGSGRGDASQSRFSRSPSRAEQPGDFDGTSNQPSGIQQNTYAGQQGSTGPTRTAQLQPPKPLPTLSARSLDLQAQNNGFRPPKDRSFANASPYGESVPGTNDSKFGATGEVKSQSEALNRFLAGETSEGELPSSGESPNLLEATGQGSQGESSRTPSDEDDNTSNQNLAQELDANGQPPEMGGTAASPSISAMASPGSPQQAAAQAGTPPPEQTPPASSMSPPPAAATMVRREGKNWALPSSMAGSVGTEVVRPITMRCHHDRYELLDKGNVVAVYPFNKDGVYRATLKLATAVRDRVSQWGATLPGGRWQPRLDVSVGPHADQRFHELQTLMNGSGVEISRRNP